MEITRDVILDLLPLYLADEVSEDSRQLVQHYLETDPKLAAMVERMPYQQLPQEIPLPINEDSEMKTYQKARLLTLQHHIFLVLALLFTFIFLVFAFYSVFEPYMPKVIPVLFFATAVFFWVGFGNVMYQINRL